MKSDTIPQTKADLHETTSPLLEALYREMQELAKKKPDSTLSEAKVKVINRLLEDVRIVLQDEPDFKYLDLFSNDALPQNSDVVLMLSQYDAAMSKFSNTYYRYDREIGSKRWAVNKPIPKRQ